MSPPLARPLLNKAGRDAGRASRGLIVLEAHALGTGKARGDCGADLGHARVQRCKAIEQARLVRVLGKELQSLRSRGDPERSDGACRPLEPVGRITAVRCTRRVADDAEHVGGLVEKHLENLAGEIGIIHGLSRQMLDVEDRRPITPCDNPVHEYSFESAKHSGFAPGPGQSPDSNAT